MSAQRLHVRFRSGNIVARRVGRCGPPPRAREVQEVPGPLDNAQIVADGDHPAAATLKGQLKLFREEPELIVTSARQITDSPPA